MDQINYDNKWWPLIYDQFHPSSYVKQLEFYLGELKRYKGPVLEVACGTGRYLLKALEQGLDIYGFDISQEMLEILYSKAKAACFGDMSNRVKKQNMVTFRYDRQFDAIFIPGHSFQYLRKQDEQIACLQNIHAHLKERGRLLFNIFTPPFEEILADSKPLERDRPFGVYTHPQTKEPIEVSFTLLNNIAEQIQTLTWRFRLKGSKHETKMYFRWVYKQEFLLLFRLAGFQKCKLYGDYDKSDYSDQGGDMIWVAEK